MDIKCKNCGQMIDENDKYCKYCGYLIPQKEAEEPLSKRDLADKIQQDKATVTQQDIEDSCLWQLCNLSVVRVGDKRSMYTRSVAGTILLFVLGLMFVCGAVLSKTLIPTDSVAFVCLMFFMLAAIVCFGFTLEKYYNTKGINALEENKVVVRKYGFKKPAEILTGGYVYELAPNVSCPICEGEIIGDLHIESIEKKLVVVCNMNRKHIFTIDEEAFLDSLNNGEVSVVDKKQKRSKTR